MATKAEIGSVLKQLVDLWPKHEFTREMAEIYANLLEDIEPRLLLAAAKQHMARSPFFPSIAELRKAAREISEARDGHPTSVEAWEWVTTHIGDSGRGRDAIGYELAERVVETLGGWTRLGQGQVDERKWVEKRFLKAYRQLLRRERFEATLTSDARRIIAGGSRPKRLEARGGMSSVRDALRLVRFPSNDRAERVPPAEPTSRSGEVESENAPSLDDGDAAAEGGRS